MLPINNINASAFNAPALGTPSADQSCRIQKIISRREAELRQVDQEIAKVRAFLKQLLSDRSDIRESLEAHKALMAPLPVPAIQRVPPEIWAHVFHLSVRDAWAASGYPRMEASKPPLIFGQVCHSWREISLSTPTLWSSLCIPKRIRETSIPLIQTWLDRAGPVLPLEIEIHALTSQFPSVILDAILPYSARLESLSLFMSYGMLKSLFTNPVFRPTSLKTLLLRPSGKVEHIDMSRVETLTSLALIVSRGVRPDPRILELWWATLSHLSVTSLSGSIDDATDLLSQCSALTSCSLTAMSSTWEAVPRPLVILPHLTSLQISSNHHPGPLLDSLTLPSLLKLEMDFIYLQYEPEIWPKDQLIALVERSACRLESLILRNKWISDADLVECCMSIPTLTHLQVNGGPGQKKLTLELLRAARQLTSTAASLQHSTVSGNP